MIGRTPAFRQPVRDFPGQRFVDVLGGWRATQDGSDNWSNDFLAVEQKARISSKSLVPGADSTPLATSSRVTLGG